MKKANKKKRNKQTQQKEVVILCIISIIIFLLYIILKLVFFVAHLPQYEAELTTKQNAINNMMIQDCDNINTITIKRDCFAEVFEIYQDINSLNVTVFCQENSIDVGYCFYGFALAKEDENICKDLKKVNNNLKIFNYCKTDVLLKRQGSQMTSYLT